MPETIAPRQSHRNLVCVEVAEAHPGLIKGSGDKDPRFLNTAFGLHANKIVATGILTDVKERNGGVVVATLRDGTGTCTVMAGQYNPDVVAFLKDLIHQGLSEVPVTVLGRANGYEMAATAGRDGQAGFAAKWVPQIQATYIRTETADEYVQGLHLALLGAAKRCQKRAAEPDATADVHFAKARDALRAAVNQNPAAAPATTVPQATAATAATADSDSVDSQVLAAIRAVETPKGAKWDDVLKHTQKAGFDSNATEAAIDRLMDRGLVFEPTLGVLKRTGT